MTLSPEAQAKVHEIIHEIEEASAPDRMLVEEALEFMRELIRDLEAHIGAIESEHQP